MPKKVVILAAGMGSRLSVWKDEVPKDRPAVVCCAYGHEISQGLTAPLRAMGVDARHLGAGIAGWREAGNAVQPIAGVAP